MAYCKKDVTPVSHTFLALTHRYTNSVQYGLFTESVIGKQFRIDILNNVWLTVHNEYLWTGEGIG